MADQRITDLTALTGANTAPDDLFVLVDVSDTTMAVTGTDKSITRQELQTYNAGTLTTDVKVLDLSATWNNAAITQTALKLNITDTASNAASLLMDLQVGGVSKFSVKKDGRVTSGNGNFWGADYVEISSLNSGYEIFLSNGGTRVAQVRALSTAGLAVCGDYPLGFANGATSATDVALRRDAADVLALRRSTNAQTFRSYRTYTDTSNYQRTSLSWNTSTALIMNEGAGTGADGNIAFNDAALATTATKGYVMIPSCAGAPTGVPADIPTGQVALHYDSTNQQIYVYNGAWLKTVALT